METKIRSPFFDVFEKFFETDFNSQFVKNKIERDENGLKLMMSLPGLSKDDLKINIKDNLLSISNEKESTFTGKFTKTYRISDDIDVDNIDGKVDKGVLILKIPFKKQKIFEKLITLN